jgi:hypothetical protein
MAKQNDTPDPLALPTPEQTGDLLLILDKEKMLLQALAKTDLDGKMKTVPAKPEHNNDFLRLNGSDDWLDSFATNFFNQAKDPTKFTLLKLSNKQLEAPLVKRAMADIDQGKITKDVVKFLEKYQVTPNNNLKNNEKMATNENPTPTTVDQQEPSRYRMHDGMIDWKQVEAHGITRDYLEQKGMLEPMLRRQKSAELVTIKGELGGTRTSYQARVSFRQQDDGRIVLQTHPLRQAPDFSRSFMGHNFSEDDKLNLMSEAGNMGRVVPLRTKDGFEDCFISRDKLTNQLVSARVSGAYIANEYSGVTLSDQEKNDLREGKPIYIEGMTSKNGKEFDATLQYNAERRGVEYIFPRSLNLEYGQELGKVPLSNKQVDDYNAGKAIFVEDMVSKKGEVFSSFIKRDDVSGRASYTRINPDNPADIYVPNEIGGVKVTPEERQQLREGKEVFLNNMTNNRGEDYSAWVKLNPETGYPMYSHDRHDFSTQQEFKIPQEVFGKTLSATERADLQDGKAVLLEGLKGYDGKEFSQWAKVNSQGNKINYTNENPDIKRDATTRSTAQAAKQTAKQERAEERKRGRGVR